MQNVKVTRRTHLFV